MSAELLCRHCGFVFWVEETLARHCQQFHLEEEKKLLEEESIRMDTRFASRKRKRRAVKEPSRGTVIEHISCASNTVAKLEEEAIMGEEDESKIKISEKNLSTTTKATKNKLSIVQHISDNNKSPSLSPEILKILPKTTKISVVAVAGVDNQKIENPTRKVVAKTRLATQKCDLCSSKFTTKARLDEHIAASHIYKCGHCKATFQSVEQLKIHLQQPHYLICELCRSSRFASADARTEHLLGVHFRCEMCEITLKSKGAVEEHMKDHDHHKSCDICEDYFIWAEPGHKCFYTRSKTRPSVYRIIY